MNLAARSGVDSRSGKKHTFLHAPTFIARMHIAIGSLSPPALNRSATHRSLREYVPSVPLFRQLRAFNNSEAVNGSASCQQLVETVEALPWTFRAPVRSVHTCLLRTLLKPLIRINIRSRHSWTFHWKDSCFVEAHAGMDAWTKP